MRETITVDDGRTFTGEVLDDRGPTVLLQAQDRGIHVTYRIPSERVRQRSPSRRAALVVGDPDPRLERALSQALDPVRALEEMFGVEVQVVNPDGTPDEDFLEAPFFVYPDGKPFQSLADAAQEAEHRHAETGTEHRAVDKAGREAYVSKGPPPDEDG